MARDLTAAVEAALQEDAVLLGALVSIDTAGGTVRIHSGIGDLVFDGYTWSGTGDLLAISPIKETEDLEAVGVRFSLVGVDPALVSLFLTHIEQGRAAQLYLALFEPDTRALIADPYLLFEGITDVPEIDLGAAEASLSITAESRLIDLKRPRVRRYTSEDQKVYHPADLGFDFVPGLQEKEIKF